MMFDVKRKFFNHLIHLSHSFHTTHKSGSIISKLIRAAGSVERMTDTIIFNVVPLFFQLTPKFQTLRRGWGWVWAWNRGIGDFLEIKNRKQQTQRGGYCLRPACRWREVPLLCVWSKALNYCKLNIAHELQGKSVAIPAGVELFSVLQLLCSARVWGLFRALRRCSWGVNSVFARLIYNLAKYFWRKRECKRMALNLILCNALRCGIEGGTRR